MYYACYYAVTALLINDGCKTHTHNGVKTSLGLHYIKDGKIEKSFGKMYNHLFNLRQSGDYEDWISIDEADIKPLLEPANQFITKIEKLIKETE
ncbi:MAG: HEPN domain-containing protein [Candidatus Azobacteroides sp.]|nr:HEPN domain-containing protein [Candidatus Azobacteroides sp.]